MFPRHDSMFGWYDSIRVLASQGYGVIMLSLSDVQDESFPRQDQFEEKHINQIISEIKEFVTHSFLDIRADGYDDILSQALAVPHFLMGHSFGGLVTLLCATNDDFLQSTNLAGFITQAPETYMFKRAEDLKEIRPVIRSEEFYEPLAVHLSPILHVKNIQKPILLMHSQYDMRVPLDHSLRFCEKAQKEGKNNLVALWVDGHQTVHNPISPMDGTLSEAKQRVDREIAIIKKFIDRKKNSL